MHDRTALVFVATLVLAAAAVALFVQSPTVLDAAVYFFYFLLLAASWNLLAGFCGQMSFAHVAFALAGAYVAAGIGNRYEALPMAAAILLSGLAVSVLGLVIGAITLRFRDITFSLATFAFAGVLSSWLVGASDITGGSTGLSVRPLFEGDQTRSFVWLGTALALLFFALQHIILSGRLGILMRAVRDREAVALGLGVATTRLKIAVFSYSAFWAGIAGGFFATYTEYITPTIGGLENMGLLVGMAVVGGIGTVPGPILGTLAFRAIDYVTRGYGGEYTVLAFATILLVMMLFFRDGLMGLVDRGLRRFRGPEERWAPSPEASPRPPADAPR